MFNLVEGNQQYCMKELDAWNKIFIQSNELKMQYLERFNLYKLEM